VASEGIEMPIQLEDSAPSPATDDYLAQLREAIGSSAGVALVNGCFDLFHAGHTRCLQQAAAFGMPLVVAINSDEYLRRRKRRHEPHSALVRSSAIRKVPGVSAVVVFDEDTPDRVIARLRPQLIVKGPEYAGVVLPERHVISEVGASLLICGDRKLLSSSELISWRDRCVEEQMNRPV